MVLLVGLRPEEVSRDDLYWELVRWMEGWLAGWLVGTYVVRLGVVGTEYVYK